MIRRAGPRRWLAMVVVAISASGCVTLDRVSSSATDHAADASSGVSAVSADGRYVAFASAATNLVPGVTDGHRHVYRKDRATGAIVNIDRRGGVGAHDAALASMSDDGNFVVFLTATALDPGVDGNDTVDAYVRDVAAGHTRVGSVNSQGTTAAGGIPIDVIEADITTDAHRLVFMTHLGNGQGFVSIRDLQTATTVTLSDPAMPRFPVKVRASGDGEHLVIAVPCEDLTRCATYPIAYDLDHPWPHLLPSCGNATFVDQSDDGRYVLLNRAADCGGRPVVVDRATGSLLDVSVPTRTSDGATGVAISGNGRVVLLTAPDDALPGGGAGRTGLFGMDLETGWTGRVGADRFGATTDVGEATGDRYSLSRDGRTAAFSSPATNLVPGGSGAHDVYARAVLSPTVTAATPDAVSRGAVGATVVLTGGELLGDALVGVSGSGVAVLGVTASPDGTSLSVELSVSAGATPGARDITVVTTAGFGGSFARCGGCLTVT